MRRTAIILILSALIIFAAALNVSAQAPNTIMYQGRLTNADGTPITGVVDDVRFRIYSGDHDAILKAIYYEQTSAIECDENGVFTIELGPITNPNATAGYARYLGIKVGTDDEMIPYQKLTSTLYSMSTADMPGIAYNTVPTANIYKTIPASSTALDTITINAPGPGYIFVSATSTVRFSHTNGTMDELQVQISDIPDYISYYTYGFTLINLPSVAASSYYSYSMAAERVFTVEDAGSYSYYLNCRMFSGQNSGDALFDAEISAIYVPNAYGTVDNPVNPSKKSNEDNLAPGETTLND